MTIETREALAAPRPSAPRPSAPSPDSTSDAAAPTGPGLSRRSVLKGIGAGAATVVVAGIGAGSYRVFDNGVLSSGSGRPYDAWGHWRDDPSPLGTVGAAILAANPHNSQPWIFHVTPTQVDLFADPSRRIGTIDPLGREQQIGLGCALENLVLAARARGFEAAVTLLPNPRDPTHVATVVLAAGPPTRSALHDAIGDRHSNRGPYKAAALPGAVLDRLAAHATEQPGVELAWFSAAADRQQLGALILDATEAIIADRQQSSDAFAWFRNNRDDIDTHMDGLTLDGQGLAPLTLSLAKLLPASSRTAGDQFWLDQTRTVHTRTAAAYGVLTVADPHNPAQRLDGGRALERIHLAATAGGLALQHMNQITERIDREQTTGARATFAPRFAELLARPGRRPLATFRIGEPTRAGGLSPRRPVSAVTR